ALFGYDKQSYDLCVVSTGDGGLEELVEELNCGKIMYAFCKVEDPNTSLSKFILINWVSVGPEDFSWMFVDCHFTCSKTSVPCLQGSHITITARTEDDVEPALILDKVSKCTASTFNFKQRSDPTESTKPIGSVYKRIQPAREISSTERERFWMKEQEEEKRRVEEEKVKAEAARNRLAEEVKERELKDARAREEWFKERSLSIDKMREAEKNAQNSTHNKVNKKLWVMVHLQQPPEQLAERQPQLEMAAASPARVATDTIQNNHGPSTASPPTELTYTRNLLRDALPPSQQPPQDHEDQSWEEEPAAARAAVSTPACTSDSAPEAASENGMQAAHTDPADTGAAEAAGPGLRARALYDYQAADDTEISFDPDDVITHIEQIDEGWWQGLGPNGTYGLFPANYVELID
ncbi:conserved hypothetical protein, partial [Ixodes scapularis]